MLSYHDFVIERHKIREQRLIGLPQPWTSDPILASHSFCNVFRVLDYGTQFLLNMTRFEWDPAEVLFRCALYRFTNRPEPWEFFHTRAAGWPDIHDGLRGTLKKVWGDYSAELRGSAYQITVGLENKGMTYLDYLADKFIPELLKVTPEFIDADSLEERVTVLQQIPRCGPFLSMQISTDYGYWDPTFSENDYILPGPGAVKGVSIFSHEDPVKVIHEWQEEWGRLGTVTLAGRPPSLMDVQNTFCEYNKYFRYSKANQIGKYTPRHLNDPDPYIPRHMKARS
jgi:hypothetical protein